jgi:LysR family hydrogen peroxide-inducible transcriptional activator
LLPKLAILDQPENDDIFYIPFQQPQPSRRNVLLIRQNYTRVETVREIVAAIRKALGQNLKL